MQFIQALPTQGYSPTTAMSHRQRLKHFIAWCSDRGLTTPAVLTKGVITRYQNQLVAAGRRDTGLPLSARYRALLLTTLGLFLDWLVTNHYLLSDLRLSIQLPKCGRRIPRQVLTVEEVAAVLHQPDVTAPLGLRNRAILETFYATGLRRQELINLLVSNIDFDSGTLRVTSGKGRKDRCVPIGDWVLVLVQRYLQEVRPTLVASPEQARLFISQSGQPLSRQHVNRIVTLAVDAAKVGKTGSCHLLRHSMATHMLDHGADIRCIQEILGHERLNTTQIYTKVSIRKLKEVHRQTHPAKLNPSHDNQPRT